MATRPPRMKRPHTYFHVTTRGTNRWNIFLNDLDRKRFMALLAIICKRYTIEVHAYCLMGNHLHLVLYCPEPVLSQAMRDLKSRYAKGFHRWHHSSGPLFEAPFVEVPILGDDHLMTEIRYCHRNPLDLDPSVCLATYPWSSHGIYVGLRPQPSFVTTRIGRELFGADYQRTVETPMPHDKVQNIVGPTVITPGEITVGAGDELTLAGILREVAAAARCDVAEVCPQVRNGLIGIAALLAKELTTHTSAETAEPFGYKSVSAVRMATRRAKVRLADDAELRRVYETVLERFQRAA